MFIFCLMSRKDRTKRRTVYIFLSLLYLFSCVRDTYHTTKHMSTSYFAITGGCGYIGLRLARYLLEINNSNIVFLLDIRPPSTNKQQDDSSRLIYRCCDLRSYDSVYEALASATCVFHLASYGMSGREMLNTKMIYEVNVIGTENIINACLKHGINKLIYCSTYNAVYTGNKELLGVTEDQCLYPKQNTYCDNYSRTKSLAEQSILKASSSQLSTVAIRPAAIYGDGEERHLPRILNLVRQGFDFFAIGHEGVLCDWVYADNLVYALVLAEKSLPEYSGEVYFISDDHPVNNFQFLSQLTNGLGYENCFAFYIPTYFMFYLGYIIEIIHYLFAKYVYNFSPFLTRAEVLKVGVAHYADITKAKKLLGYQVKVSPREAMQRCIKWYDQHGYRKKTEKNNHKYLWLLIASLIMLLIIYFYQFAR
jgi:nucleoside-diphosphate-sugar epimerase